MASTINSRSFDLIQQLDFTFVPRRPDAITWRARHQSVVLKGREITLRGTLEFHKVKTTEHGTIYLSNIPRCQADNLQM
jgi:hypothetical protein